MSGEEIEKIIRELIPSALDVSYVSLVNEDSKHWMVDDRNFVISGLEELQNPKPEQMRELIRSKL